MRSARRVDNPILTITLNPKSKKNPTGKQRDATIQMWLNEMAADGRNTSEIVKNILADHIRGIQAIAYIAPALATSYSAGKPAVTASPQSKQIASALLSMKD